MFWWVPPLQIHYQLYVQSLFYFIMLPDNCLNHNLPPDTQEFVCAKLTAVIRPLKSPLIHHPWEPE